LGGPGPRGGTKEAFDVGKKNGSIGGKRQSEANGISHSGEEKEGQKRKKKLKGGEKGAHLQNHLGGKGPIFPPRPKSFGFGREGKIRGNALFGSWGNPRAVKGGKRENVRGRGKWRTEKKTGCGLRVAARS